VSIVVRARAAATMTQTGCHFLLVAAWQTPLEPWARGSNGGLFETTHVNFVTHYRSTPHDAGWKLPQRYDICTMYFHSTVLVAALQICLEPWARVEWRLV
jgi:hypothetical protein